MPKYQTVEQGIRQIVDRGKRAGLQRSFPIIRGRLQNKEKEFSRQAKVERGYKRTHDRRRPGERTIF